MKNEKVKIAETMIIILSADQRTVDATMGAKFRNAFKRYTGNPLAVLTKVVINLHITFFPFYAIITDINNDIPIEES